jgi:AraC family transcriptional activator FtrA
MPPVLVSTKKRPLHRVVTVMGPSVSLFELAVPCEVFGIWRGEIPTWNYEHLVVSSSPFSAAGQGGLRLQAGADLDAVSRADTVVVAPAHSLSDGPPGGYEPILAALREAHDRGARLMSMCTGAFLLAEAGLLDGRRATTHWMHAAAFAARFPQVSVDPRVLWVQDGDIYTSAGTAAAIDLCLHLVRNDLGADAANRVARRMVVPPHRDGGQAQYIESPVPACPDDDPLAELLAWMVGHLDEDLTVAQLARRAHLSPRTFARRFVEATGTTPLQWLLHQRVVHARTLLETTDLAVEEVARRCGFSTAAGLRVHFQRATGAAPNAYRRVFQQQLAS